MFGRVLGSRAATLALRSATAHHVAPQSTIRIQRVAFRQPSRPIRKALVTTSCLLLATFVLTDVLDPFIFEDEKEHDHNTRQIPGSRGIGRSEAHNHHREDGVGELEGVFIPFPFVSFTYQPPRYRAKDPEWQRYVEFSKNKQLHSHMIADLLRLIIRDMGVKEPYIEKHLNAPRTRVFLNIRYPDAPTKELHHKGLLYTADGDLYWTSRKAESQVMYDLDRIFKPRIIAKFFWNKITDSIRHKYSDFCAIYFPDTTKPQRPVIQINPLAKPPQQQTKIIVEKRDSENTSFIECLTRMSLTHALEVTEPMKTQYKSLMADMMRTWKANKYPPPSGALCITGMVEVEMMDSVHCFDVVAHWTPADKQFHKGSLYVFRRIVLPKIQRPAP